MPIVKQTTIYKVFSNGNEKPTDPTDPLATKSDIVAVEGPQGPQGIPGTNGTNGADGADGFPTETQWNDLVSRVTALESA